MVLGYMLFNNRAHRGRQDQPTGRKQTLVTVDSKVAGSKEANVDNSREGSYGKETNLDQLADFQAENTGEINMESLTLSQLLQEINENEIENGKVRGVE